MKKPVVVIVGMVVLGVALTLVADLAWNWLRPPQLHGMVLQSHERALDFTLNDEAGQPVKLSDFRGKLVLLYFGYTFCPDVCPATLAQVKEALAQLGGDAERVQLIMISVDPERDSVKHLKEYTAFFHPEMIGATGTVEEIATLAKAYGAGYILQPKRADGSYAVDHTTSTYVIGPDGKLASVLELGAPTDKVVAAVRKLL